MVTATFAILFIILRMVVWPLYCYPFWVRSIQLMIDYYMTNSVMLENAFPAINLQMVSKFSADLDQFSGLPPLPATTHCHSIVVVVFFVVANFLLTVLQYYWGTTIFGFLFKKPSARKTQKRE